MSDKPKGFTENKLDAKIFIIPHTRGAAEIGPFTAVVHLFEHPYPGLIDFWYGAALLDTDYNDVRDLSAPLGSSINPHPGFLVNPMGSKIRIELEDGRWGLAILALWTGNSTLQDRHYQIAFQRYTNLTVKP